jgi:tRNA nucleotidyltransferase (CCA-adding enzyme)
MNNKKDFKMKITTDAKEIIQLLEDNGYSGYVVGGCVRDALLGKTPHDYDICTSATPEQMKDIFIKSGHNTYDTGIQHGTISVMGKEHALYEVTTFRCDGDYTDGRHPDSVQFVSDIDQDLARRDFSVNAMAYSPTRGLVDPFGGAKDLEKGLIRCVGDPNKRFQEDGLRIMRAIRFAATYGFEIEPETQKAIHDNKHLLQNVSAERKTVEFVKMLTHAKAELLMEYSDVIAEFIPEIKPMIGFDQKTPWHKYDVYEHTARAVELTPNDPTLRLAVFFHDIGKPPIFQVDSTGRGHFKLHPEKSTEMTEQIMRRMKFDTQSIKDVCVLVKHHDDPLTRNMDSANMKCLLREIGEENLRRLVSIQIADKQAQRGTREELEKMDRAAMTYEDAVILGQLRALDKYDNLITHVVQSGEPYQIKDLAINGHDLIVIGLKGKDIGDVLNLMLLDVIKHPKYNTKERLMRGAERYRNYINNIETHHFNETEQVNNDIER